jgi:hypothetical protein
MKPAETAGGQAMPRGFETLVQCLHQYVNANPSRFTARDEGSDRLRILTVIPVQITDQP